MSRGEGVGDERGGGANWAWRVILTSIPKRLWSEQPVCSRCGYLLVGLAAEGMCPECGGAYDGVNSHLSGSRTWRQLKIWGLIYLVTTVLFPIAVGRVQRVYRVGEIVTVLAIVLTPFLCANVTGAVVALVAEFRSKVGGWVSTLLLLAIIVVFMFFMIGTCVAMVWVATMANRMF